MAEELLSNTLSNDGKDVVVKGSCLCGAIKYTIEGTPSTTVLCHCISCKKQSGSAFKANSIYSISQFHITTSLTTLKVYNDRSPDAGDVVVERYFCGECGSNLYIKNPKFPGAIIVATGTMEFEDLGTKWRPEREYYCKRRGEWLEERETVGTIKFEGMV